MLPAITFIFSRKACDDARDVCLDAGLRLTTPDERARVRAIVDERTAALADADLDVLGFDRFLAGLEMGVAAHHAGMVPPFKEAVEACFTEGLTKAVFATETLALGVNMPARSVVIERLTKFSGERRELLTPGEYTQLTGRAGRRGIDEVGYAIVLWSPFVPFEQVAALASSRTYALRSAFRPTYNMAANLVRRYQPDEAHHLLNLSFAQFQADKAVVRLEARIERQHGRLARLREEAALRARRRRGVPPAPRPPPSSRGRGARAAGGRGAVDRTFAALSRLTPGDVSSSTAPRWRCSAWPSARATRASTWSTSAASPARSAPTSCPSRRTRSAPSSSPSRTTRTTAPSSTRWARRCDGPGSAATACPSTSAAERRRGLRRGRGAPGGRLPRPRRARPQRRAGRAGGPRARRPAAPGAGSHRLAGPPVRPGPAPARGVGLPRRLGAHGRPARCWPARTTSPICSSPRR